MAKKRKNDTRIDPFATAVESSSLDALLENAQAGDQIIMPAPSDPNREIKLYCKLIKNQEIVEISLKEEALLNTTYKDELESSSLVNNTFGPHYRLEVSSIESFEKRYDDLIRKRSNLNFFLRFSSLLIDVAKISIFSIFF